MQATRRGDVTQLLKLRYQQSNDLQTYRGDFRTGLPYDAFCQAHRGKESTYHEMTLLSDGHPLAISHYCARWVVQDFGKGDIYRLYPGQHPITCDELLHVEKHDIAIINRRHIIDLWLCHYAGVDDQCVFDLASAKDRVKIDHYYGDARYWYQHIPGQKRFVALNDPVSHKASARMILRHYRQGAL